MFFTADQILNKVTDQDNNFLKVGGKKETYLSGGKKTLADADTAEVLSATEIACAQLWLQALSTNTKPIHFATIEELTNDFPDLQPGDSVILNISDVSEVYIKAEVDGEGVKWGAIV